MELVKPAFGLVFWMLVSFGIIVFVLLLRLVKRNRR